MDDSCGTRGSDASLGYGYDLASCDHDYVITSSDGESVCVACGHIVSDGVRFRIIILGVRIP